MRYLDKTFTLPVSQGVSQREWNRIFAPELEPKLVEVRPGQWYSPEALEVLNKNSTFPVLKRNRGSRKRTAKSA